MIDRQKLKAIIEKNSMPITESGCWIWLKATVTHRNGYGNVRIKKKSMLAHRISWMAFRGDIPKGSLVLHKCDIKPCVNPDHLFLGDHYANAIDMVCKGRNKPRPGILNPKAKLTPADVIAIRQSKLGPVKLAKKYGLTRGNVWRIRTRKYWDHVP